jgi:GH15 family glucan-1,4-alpha-glucosidase
LSGDASTWRRLRSQIHEDVCRDGFDPGLNSFVQYYGAREPDASLLMLPLVPKRTGCLAILLKRSPMSG